MLGFPYAGNALINRSEQGWTLVAGHCSVPETHAAGPLTIREASAEDSMDDSITLCRKENSRRRVNSVDNGQCHIRTRVWRILCSCVEHGRIWKYVAAGEIGCCSLWSLRGDNA